MSKFFTILFFKLFSCNNIFFFLILLFIFLHNKFVCSLLFHPTLFLFTQEFVVSTLFKSTTKKATKIFHRVFLYCAVALRQHFLKTRVKQSTKWCYSFILHHQHHHHNHHYWHAIRCYIAFIILFAFSLCKNENMLA